MNPITTARLQLVPATADLVRCEIDNRGEFFRQLGVKPVPNWPSENLADVLPFFLEQLENDPSLAGWLAWYWILNTSDRGHLVGGGGFKGAPVDGKVEIGFETRLSFRRIGIATEAAGAQVTWALGQPDVSSVMAKTNTNNRASIAVLRKLGFVPMSPGSEADILHFER